MYTSSVFGDLPSFSHSTSGPAGSPTEDDLSSVRHCYCSGKRGIDLYDNV